jgi:hypothetical protein
MGRAAGSVVLALAMAVPGAAWAQFRAVPAMPYYAINPNAPLAPRADAPVQQQVLQNYRTQLQQSYREMLQQNPSGLGREQLDMGRQLNALGPGYGSAGLPPAVAPAPGGPPGGAPTAAAPR